MIHGTLAGFAASTGSFSNHFCWRPTFCGSMASDHCPSRLVTEVGEDHSSAFGGSGQGQTDDEYYGIYLLAHGSILLGHDYL